MSKIFTQASLQQRSLPELRAAFARAQRELVLSMPNELSPKGPK